ncbi:MAG: hypothetical protein MMC33_008323 [Icmadophila ericetorum]|nr:hypothetical protein [Icmadophila ericetorum]
MLILPMSLLSLGSILLLHATYSTYEHSLLLTPTTTASPASSTTPAISSLPLDIILETLISVLLLCAGLVLNAETLKPIEWRIWAGEVDHGKPHVLKRGEQPQGEFFRGLEKGSRRGFVDIRGQRKAFEEWVKGQNGAGRG